MRASRVRAGWAPANWLRRQRAANESASASTSCCSPIRIARVPPASLDELARVLARYPNEARVQVLVVTAGGVGPRAGSLEQAGEARPPFRESRYGLDAGGIEARRFGIETSGTLCSLLATAPCCSAGGITAGRGESGSSAGGEALAALLNAEQTLDRATPLFRLSPFFDPSRTCKQRTRHVSSMSQLPGAVDPRADYLFANTKRPSIAAPISCSRSCS